MNEKMKSAMHLAALVTMFGYIVLLVVSAIILLLLLPFGYNFTDTWLYAFMVPLLAIGCVALVYQITIWWQKRGTAETVSGSSILAFVLVFIGIGLMLMFDPFSNANGVLYFVGIFAYSGLFLFIGKDLHKKYQLVILVMIFCVYMSLHTITNFPELLPLDHNALDTIQGLNYILRPSLLLIIPVLSSLKSKQKIA